MVSRKSTKHNNLSREEAKLFHLLEDGSDTEIYNYLERHPDISMKKKNQKGRSAIQIAIYNRNYGVLSMLTKFDLNPLDVIKAAYITSTLPIYDKKAFGIIIDYMLRTIGNPSYPQPIRKCEQEFWQCGGESNEYINESILTDDTKRQQNKKKDLSVNECQLEEVKTDETTSANLQKDNDTKEKQYSWFPDYSTGQFVKRVSLSSPNSFPHALPILLPFSVFYPGLAGSGARFDMDDDFRKKDDEWVSLSHSEAIEALLSSVVRDDFPVIWYFLQRNLYIPLPHRNHCNCPGQSDPLVSTGDRISLYEALTSTIYVMLSNDDPVLVAMLRSEELERLSHIYPENMTDYQALSSRSAEVAEKLMSLCESEEEVRMLLRQEEDTKNSQILEYPRLQRAVQLKQKKFLTNTKCQDVLKSMWLGDRPDWRTWTVTHKVLHVLGQMIFMPFLCFSYIIAYSSDVFLVKYVRVPMNRFIYAVTSYCIFLGILFFTTIDGSDKRAHLQLYWYDYALIIWIGTHIHKILQDMHWSHFRSFWMTWWTVYELILMGLFATALGFIVASSFIDAAQTMLTPLSINHDLTRGTMRMTMIGQGLFAIGCSLAFTRTLEWLHLSHKLGHLVISLSRMASVILQLFLVFIIVFSSFSAGIHSLYKDFRPLRNHLTNNSQTNNSEDNSQEKSSDIGKFMSYSDTVEAFFWALMGQGEAENAQIPDNYDWLPERTDHAADSNYMAIVLVGYGLWGLFHVGVVIILLNMVIAVMNYHFEQIQENCDVEWKFARTKLYMFYFEKHNAVPPPFNLVNFIRRKVKRLIFLMTRCFSSALCKDHHYSTKKTKRVTKEQYKVLMQKLIKRYLQNKMFSNDNSKPMEWPLRDLLTSYDLATTSSDI